MDGQRSLLPLFVQAGVNVSSGSLVVLAGISLMAALYAKCPRDTAKGRKIQAMLMAGVVGALGAGGWYARSYLFDDQNPSLMNALPPVFSGESAGHENLSAWRQVHTSFLAGFVLLVGISIGLLEYYVIAPIEAYCTYGTGQTEPSGVLGALLQTRQLIYGVLTVFTVGPLLFSSWNIRQYKKEFEDAAGTSAGGPTGLMGALARAAYAKTGHAKRQSSAVAALSKLSADHGGFMKEGPSAGSTQLADNTLEFGKLLGYGENTPLPTAAHRPALFGGEADAVDLQSHT